MVKTIYDFTQETTPLMVDSSLSLTTTGTPTTQPWNPQPDMTSGRSTYPPLYTTQDVKSMPPNSGWGSMAFISVHYIFLTLVILCIYVNK